jgi:hypothetical protein
MSEGLILAEFKGTYRAPHPDGFQNQNVERPFHVKVKMKRESLQAPGLNGLFVTYYSGFMKKLFPDMIELYRWENLGCTELDGSPIEDDPKAMNRDQLLAYIKRKKYNINALLYPTVTELRNEVVLYETDRAGQQYLEGKRQELKGNLLEMAAEIAELDDVVVIVDPNAAPAPTPVAKVEEKTSVESLLLRSKAKAKAAAEEVEQ